MAQLFQYVRPEQMADTFRAQRAGILAERRIVAARRGDFTLFLEKIDDERLSLTLEEEGHHLRYAGRRLDISRDSDEAVADAVRTLEARLQTLYQEEVTARREQIWKWAVMEWLEEHDITFDDFIEVQLGKKELPEGQEHWPGKEEFLHGTYMDIGSVLHVIERFAQSDVELEEYRRFAVADVMELQQERSRARLMSGLMKGKRDDEERPVQTFTFRIEVEATDAAEAEDKLRRCLRELRDPDIRLSV